MDLALSLMRISRSSQATFIPSCFGQHQDARSPGGDPLRDIALSLDKNPITTPINLSHCCRRWRDVALKAAVLWRHILIQKPQPSYLERVKVWVERSKNSVIDIHIFRAQDRNNEFHPHLEACLVVLLNHTARWRELIINVSYRSSKLGPGLFTQIFCPQLVKVVLYFRSNSFKRDACWGVLGIVAPNIRELKIEGLVLADRPDLWSTPIVGSGLRKLYIKYHSQGILTLEAYLSVLRHCPYLEQVAIRTKLETPANEPGDYPRAEQVIAAHLQTAWFDTFPDMDEAPSFFTRIEAPKLRRLHPHIPFSFVPQLVRLPRFPFPALDRLCLSPTSSEARAPKAVLCSAELATFMSHLSELSTLELRYVDFPALEGEPYRFMLALTSICPRLGRLTLENCHGEQMLEALRTLIKGRRQQPSVQQIVSLRVCRLTAKQKGWKWFSENLEEFEVMDF